MALRIAVAVFAALRAVLVYGEAGRLCTRPVHVASLTANVRPIRVTRGAALPGNETFDL
jgi:hypothetical protein